MIVLEADARARLAATLEELSRLAHKMNNPLTSLLGRAQLLQLDSAADENVRHAANVIEESAARIAAHVRELASLAREAREVVEAASPAPAAAGPPDASVR